jgi:hypothetical protein
LTRELEALKQKLVSSTEWMNVVKNFQHEYVHDERSICESALKDILSYLALKANPTDSALNPIMSSLRSQTLVLLNRIDSTNLCNIVAKNAPLFLSEFSYSTSDIRSREEKMVQSKLNNLTIPKQAWDRFWEHIDQNKSIVLERMRVNFQRYGSFSFRSELFWHAEKWFDEPINFQQMSPFSTSEPLEVAIAALLGFSNTETGEMRSEPEVSLASVLASGVGAARPKDAVKHSKEH